MAYGDNLFGRYLKSMVQTSQAPGTPMDMDWKRKIPAPIPGSWRPGPTQPRPTPNPTPTPRPTPTPGPRSPLPWPTPGPMPRPEPRPERPQAKQYGEDKLGYIKALNAYYAYRSSHGNDYTDADRAELKAVLDEEFALRKELGLAQERVIPGGGTDIKFPGPQPYNRTAYPTQRPYAIYSKG